MRAATPQSREAGLRRLNRLTAWLAAGAVGATGIIAAAAANALPGRSSSSPASGVQTPGGSGEGSAPSTVAPADGSSDSTGLQPPVQAPSSTRRSHHVVSGGS